MKKKLVSLLLCLVIALSAIPAFAAAPTIRKTEYEGSGVVEVEFKKDVQYKNAKVRVKDSAGKFYTVKIVEKDEDDLTFKVSGVASGKTYAYEISGVRTGRSGSYGKVTGQFKTPAAAKLSIKSVECDASDRELDLEFSGKVQYKSAKVKVVDAKGKAYTAKIAEKDSDEMEIYVKGLKKGTQYSVQISGVRLKGASSYGTVSKIFTAR